jgi:hypothetical protein
MRAGSRQAAKRFREVQIVRPLLMFRRSSKEAGTEGDLDFTKSLFNQGGLTMKTLAILIAAALLAGCQETGDAVREVSKYPLTSSKGYELGCINQRANPPIDCWNGAFATGGSGDN